jgi:hypothetical protein
MANGAVRSRDGVARPPQEIAEMILNAKEKRLEKPLKVSQVRLYSDLERKGHMSIGIPGRAGKENVLAKTGSSERVLNTNLTRKEWAFSTWAFNALCLEEVETWKQALPTSTSPIGRLKMKIRNWKQNLPNAWWQHKLIEQGYKIECPGYNGQKCLPQALEDRRQRDLIWKELEKEVDVGVLTVHTPQTTKDLFNGTVPKWGSNEVFFVNVNHIVQNGKPRVVWNMVELNKYGKAKHYKCYPVQELQHRMETNHFFGALDFKRYYHSMELHPISKRLCLVWVGNKEWTANAFNVRVGTPVVLQAETVVFGMRDAPRLMTKLLRPIDILLQQRADCQLVRIMDDIVFMFKTIKQQLEGIKIVFPMLMDLGLLISWKKCQFRPNHVVKFYGLIWDSRLYAIFIPREKILRMQEQCKKLVKMKAATASAVASIAGKILSVAVALYPARLWLQNFRRFINKTVKEVGWYKPVLIPAAVKEEARVWPEKLIKFNGLSVQPPPISHVLADDAAEYGYGGMNLITYKAIQAVWKGKKEETASSNQRELIADIQTAIHFIIEDDLRNVAIAILSDNSTGVSYINQFGGKVEVLHNLIHNFLEWALTERNIIIHSFHVPGQDQIELGTDGASRGTIPRFCLTNYLETWLMKITQKRIHLMEFHKIKHQVIKIKRAGLKDKVHLVTPMWSAAAWFHLLVQMSCTLPIWIPSHRSNVCVEENLLAHKRRFIIQQGLLVWSVCGSSTAPMKLKQRMFGTNFLEPEKMVEIFTVFRGYVGRNSVWISHRKEVEVLFSIYRKLSL